MPVRRFNGTSDLLRFAKGANDITDAFSAAMLIRPSTIAPAHELAAGLMEGSKNAEGTELAGYGLYQNAAKVVFEVDAGGTEKNDEQSFTPLLEAGVWYFVVVTRPAGEKQKVQWTFCKFTGSTPGAFNHRESGSTQLRASSIGASGTLNLAKASDGSYFFAGDIALAARWDKALTQAQAEGLVGGATKWRELGPKFMVELKQALVTEEVPDVSGNGGNQAARSGTTVVAEEPPVPYVPVAQHGLTLLGAGT